MENQQVEAVAALEQGVQVALETYSNVHRGSGHNSMVTTYLYEQARDIVLEYLGLDKGKYTVIFCTPRRAETLQAQLKPESYQSVSSQDLGLPLGVRAVAVDRRALSRGTPFQTGGGTARLVFPDRVIWSHMPDRFEAGTPAIVNVIAFAAALRLIRRFGNDAFRDAAAESLGVAGNVAAAEILYHDELDRYAGRELLDQLRLTLIGSGVLVPTVEGALPYVNLDNGASTPTFMPIWNTVRQTWHQPEVVQQRIVQEVKSICADVLGVSLSSYDVVFASNTTEAINLVAESLRAEAEPGIDSMILTTFLEHNSNELPWRTIPGFSVIRLPVDAEGFIDSSELETLLSAYNQKGEHGKSRIKLVAVSGASNVLGVYNDLAAISQIAHQYGAKLLVDAAQLVAHRRIEMEKCGIDYLAFSAHKVYAPFGTGALVVRKGLLHFSPAQLARIQTSGEENVGGIAALGKALVLLQRISLDVIQKEEQALTAQILHGMAQVSGLTIYGIRDPNSPRFAQKGGVIAFNLNRTLPGRVAKELAEQGGIGVRYGCHCAHLLIKRLLNISPLLERVQGVIVTLFPQVVLPGVVRVSLGIENTEADVDALLRVLGNIARQHASTQDGKPSSSPSAVQPRMDDFARAVARKVYTQLT